MGKGIEVWKGVGNGKKSKGKLKGEEGGTGRERGKGEGKGEEKWKGDGRDERGRLTEGKRDGQGKEKG